VFGNGSRNVPFLDGFRTTKTFNLRYDFLSSYFLPDT
jgi:hypothetical protein